MKTNHTVRCSFAAAAVAQIFNLLYRGFATRMAQGEIAGVATLRRLQAGDTAGCKPALRVPGVRCRPAFPVSLLLALLCLALFACSASAADEVTTALQKGLFEEEANQNLEAAIKAYQAVLERHDEQRKLASTALFRLGECYRKLGRTNDAVAQYQRLLRDYSDQMTLTTLSRQNLTGLGVAVPPTSPAPVDFNTRLKAVTDAAATNEEENEVRRIQALIKDSPDLINAPSQVALSIAGASMINRSTPLLKAASLGQLVVARFLLESGADPNLAVEQVTPLYAAASAGHKAMCELLLKLRADPNLKGQSGRTSLHQAANQGFRSVVETLLDHKADVNAEDVNGGTPLCDATARGFLSIAQLLLERGANPNLSRKATDKFSNTTTAYDSEYFNGAPLHFAVQRSSLPLVELLLTNHADVNLRRSYGLLSPLDLAASSGETNLALLFVQAGADVNASPKQGDNAGWTPLHHAVNNVRREVAELLLKNGANPNARLGVAWPRKQNGESGFTPLLIASYQVQPQLGLLLLDFKADPNLKSSIGNAPLHTAFSPVFLNARRSREYITALLDRGAEVQALNASGFSPLSQATWTGQRDLVQLLLDRGANPNQREMGDDKKDRLLTPLSGLMTITNKDMAPVVETLLLAKSDPNLKSDLGYTALHRAIQFNQPAKIIELLATHGANVETTTPDGETPLTLAASANEPKGIFSALLKAGANPNARGKFGFTTLHKAVRLGNREAIEVLLAAGANPNLTDEQGVTPLDIAKDWLKTPRPVGPIPAPVIQTQMVETLRKAGASEWAPRPNQITVFRRSTGAIEIPFLKDKDGRNRFSLFEVIATIGFGKETRFPFPDLTNVTITRIEAGSGALTNFTVNIAGRVASGDCRQNMWLEWGDLIEVPELEHKLTEQWTGLTTEFVRAVTNCLWRSFTLTVKGQATRRTARPLVNSRTIPTAPNAPGGWIPTGFERMRFSLMAVVHDSGLLLSSSDRSRVKVKRTAPDTGEVREWTYNVEKDAGPNDLWLRDGDEIEVPEK